MPVQNFCQRMYVYSSPIMRLLNSNGRKLKKKNSTNKIKKILKENNLLSNSQMAINVLGSNITNSRTINSHASTPINYGISYGTDEILRATEEQKPMFINELQKYKIFIINPS